MNSTIKRTPDGKPERRTPDEMLRDAVSDNIDIPGKGKPLDLKAYFRPDAEHRMAGKILRDWQPRLKTWQRSQKPSLWQRVFRST